MSFSEWISLLAGMLLGFVLIVINIFVSLGIEIDMVNYMNVYITWEIG